MKKIRLVLLAGVIPSVCLFAKIITDYDHAVDFSRYRTYSWIAVDVQDPLWQGRVQQAIENQLAVKGWHKIESGADASISAVGSSHIERTLETWYSGGFGGGWYHRGWWGAEPGISTTTVERTRIGTLHIDIFDAQSKKLIWHGDASGALSGDAEKDQKKLDKALADVFRAFPPPPTGGID